MIDAETPALDSAIQRWVRAWQAGVSIVVRSTVRQAIPANALSILRGLAPAETVVTDLHDGSSTSLHPRSAGLEGEPCDEPVLAYTTSGSTGSPRYVVYRQSVVRVHAQVIADALQLSDEYRHVALQPPGFAYGLSVLTSHLSAGVPVTFLDAEWGLPGLCRTVAEADRSIAVYALPQHIPHLLSAQIDPAKVGRLYVAGGRVSAQSAAALARRFPHVTLTNMYGQAEMGPRLTLWHGQLTEFTAGHIGKPLPGVELRVERSAVDGGPGELLASTPFAMWRHLSPPYLKVLPGPIPGQFVETGDLGTLLDGQLVHQGRSGHFVKVAGRMVDLALVERRVNEAFQPLLTRATTRPSRAVSDPIPVLEIVPGSAGKVDVARIRQLLHAEYGSLIGLFDIRVVDFVAPGVSGK